MIHRNLLVGAGVATALALGSSLAAAEPVEIRIQGDYLVGPDRDGLRFTGGDHGGSFDETFTFDVRPADSGSLTLPFAAAPGDDTAIFELYRLAAPLPVILPSYNQIGFDSLHYLAGAVEGTPERALVWVVAGRRHDGKTVVDPGLALRFPLVMQYDTPRRLSAAIEPTGHLL